MKRLIEYLPPHIAADGEVRAIQDALQAEMDAEWDANDDLKAQIFPQTATWTLDRWEAAYGLRPAPTAQIAQRRADLLARIRSARTATAEAVRDLCQSYTDGAVTVEEYPAEYRIEILIEEFDASPDWQDAMKAALEDFLPAHLAFGVRMSVREAVTEYAHAATLGWCITDSARTLSS